MSWSKRIFIALLLLYLGVCAAVYFGQEAIIFHPKGLAEDHVFQFVRPFEEIEIQMEDGVDLHAIHFTLKDPEGIVLFWHGNSGNVERCSPIAGQFLSRGYEAFIVDYRGYGKSGGERSQETLYSDGLEVYDYVQNEFEEDEIIVYGQSLGSGVATYIAAHREPSLLLLETPYTSLEDVAAAQYPFLPVSFLLRYPMPSEEYIDEVRCPIYIFHGTEDEVVPYAQGKELSQQNVLAKLITLEGGGHNSSTLFKEYQDAMDEALLGYIREDQAEVVVQKRPKKVMSIAARADSLRVYFDHTAEKYDVDSLWLLYFRKFPRNFDDFIGIYGTADTTLAAPLRADAAIHLQLFFEQVEAHRQIRPERLFIDLAATARPSGGAVDDLRKGIQDSFLKNDSAYVVLLAKEPEEVQRAYWTFYLDGLLMTEAVRQDLLMRLGEDEDMLAMLNELIPPRTVAFADTLMEDPVGMDSAVLEEVDSIALDSMVVD